MEHHQNLPNLLKKKLISGFLVILVIGGGFYVFKDFFKNQNQQRSLARQDLSVSEPLIAEEIDKDSDDDGLKDWEEILWKTDLNNPDTDKDGTSDSQEIKEGRNPLMAGKNDKLETPKTAETESSSPEYSATLTEFLGQQFFSNFLSLRESSGGTISSRDKENIIASFLETINVFGQNPKELYTKLDIKISSQENQNSVKEYGNNLALVIKKYFDQIPETEMTVLQKSLEAESKTDLEKLKQIAMAYRTAAKNFLSLEAPPGFSNSHLQLINYFNSIAQEIDSLQKIFGDPAQALLALKQYQEDSKEAYQILKSLNDYFLNKNIVFQDDEPAGIFKVYSN